VYGFGAAFCLAIGRALGLGRAALYGRVGMVSVSVLETYVK
jgi:hypothetical protein